MERYFKHSVLIIFLVALGACKSSSSESKGDLVTPSGSSDLPDFDLSKTRNADGLVGVTSHGGAETEPPPRIFDVWDGVRELFFSLPLNDVEISKPSGGSFSELISFADALRSQLSLEEIHDVVCKTFGNADRCEPLALRERERKQAYDDFKRIFYGDPLMTYRPQRDNPRSPIPAGYSGYRVTSSIRRTFLEYSGNRTVYDLIKEIPALRGAVRVLSGGEALNLSEIFRAVPNGRLIKVSFVGLSEDLNSRLGHAIPDSVMVRIDSPGPKYNAIVTECKNSRVQSEDVVTYEYSQQRLIHSRSHLKPIAVEGAQVCLASGETLNAFPSFQKFETSGIFYPDPRTGAWGYDKSENRSLVFKSLSDPVRNPSLSTSSGGELADCYRERKKHELTFARQGNVNDLFKVTTSKRAIQGQTEDFAQECVLTDMITSGGAMSALRIHSLDTSYTTVSNPLAAPTSGAAHNAQSSYSALQGSDSGTISDANVTTSIWAWISYVEGRYRAITRSGPKSLCSPDPYGQENPGIMNSEICRLSPGVELEINLQHPAISQILSSLPLATAMANEKEQGQVIEKIKACVDYWYCSVHGCNTQSAGFPGCARIEVGSTVAAPNMSN